IDKGAELIESYLGRVLEDVGKILRVTKVEKPKRICLYVAQDWKWQAYRIAMKRVGEEKVDLGALLREIGEKLGLRLHKSDLSKFLQQTVKELRGMPSEELEILETTEIDELQVMLEAADFIREQLNVKEVRVFKADDAARYDPQDRARLAVPMRPAIFIE
ncbi:MAG: hypothetical protein KAV43_01795, partial [Hadesarchaea archaeon]|nr:hypothetical protein [Hadesarchaea archaeon]